MTLDRDAARALFDNAPATPASVGGSTPFAAASPFGEADTSFDARTSGHTARTGPNWKLIAPVGVAALLAVAVLVVVQTRDPAEPGKTVAASSPMAPLNPPSALPPIETAEVAAPPASSIIAPPATPVVRTAVRTAPARRAPAPRTVAVAPSATDASSNVSTYERYVPPPAPSLGAPVTITPAPAPPPIIAEPTPSPTIPPQ